MPKIISKFHDYYDCAQTSGATDGPVFVREAKEWSDVRRRHEYPEPFSSLLQAVVERAPSSLSLSKASKRYQTVLVWPGFVLVAGRFYPFAEVRVRRRGEFLFDETRHLYDYAELRSLLAEHDFDLEDRDKVKHLPWQPQDRWKWENFFTLAGSDQWLPVAQEFRWALLSWQGSVSTLRLNPRLADLQFYRKLNAWQVFQELSMFLGNLAAPERNTVVIEDKYRIAQHGFDQWSFRKMPQTSK